MPTPSNNGKKIHLTDKQARSLLIILWQQGDAIDELWDAMIELKCHASVAGMPVKNALEWQDAARKRDNVSALLKTQRRKFFEGLGLNFD
jgi:hypothetical protein